MQKLKLWLTEKPTFFEHLKSDKGSVVKALRFLATLSRE
jgi:hypothetical protein